MDQAPFIHPVDEDSDDEIVSEIFIEMRAYFGFIPNLYRTLAHFPPLLQANWSKLKAVMSAGPLRAELKEAIAVSISRSNDCEYCVRLHRRVLRELRVSDADLTALIRQQFHAVGFLDQKEKLLLEFAAQVNKSPFCTGGNDIAALHEAGASNEEIIHALGVVEVYLAYNKLLVALRVEKESPDQVECLRYPPYVG